MPVRERPCTVPVGRIAMYLLRKIQQEVFSRTFVKPQYAQEVVPSPASLPVILEEHLIRKGHLPSEEVCHQINHPAVTGIFIV